MTGSELKQGSIIAGRYQLERELERGGMGWLWIASDPRLRRQVVVKLILSRGSPEMAPEIRDRFEREACAAAKLRSPHVVQIHDYGLDHDRAYMVMELLEGEDLGKRLRKRSRLPLAEVGKIVAQAAKALEQIHAAGMLHRDLKPGNVFLARVDGEETVKVIDFGIVRTTDSGRWTHGAVGTPRYMSPEQFAGIKGIDARSDLWSLAVIAYGALSGKPPFNGRTMSELGTQLQKAELPLLTRIVPELPPSADAFFKRALALSPDARYATAAEMAAAFAKVCRDAVTATRVMGTKRALASATPSAAPIAPGSPAEEVAPSSPEPHRGEPEPTGDAVPAASKREPEPAGDVVRVASKREPEPAADAVPAASKREPVGDAVPAASKRQPRPAGDAVPAAGKRRPDAGGEPCEVTRPSAPEPVIEAARSARSRGAAEVAVSSRPSLAAGAHGKGAWLALIAAALALVAGGAAFWSFVMAGATDELPSGGAASSASSPEVPASADTPPTATPRRDFPGASGPRGVPPVATSRRAPAARGAPASPSPKSPDGGAAPSKDLEKSFAP